MTIRCPYCGDPQRNSDMTSRAVSTVTIREHGHMDSCLGLECEACGRYFEFHDLETLAGINTSKHMEYDPGHMHRGDDNVCPYCGDPQRTDYNYLGTMFIDDEHFMELHKAKCPKCGMEHYRYEWYEVSYRVYLDDRGRIVEEWQ